MHPHANNDATLRALCLALRDRAWIDPRWDDRAKRIAWCFGTSLDQALAGTELAPSLARARELALDAGGDGPALYGETVLAASIAGVARTLVRRTHDEPDAAGGADAIAAQVSALARWALVHPPLHLAPEATTAATERVTVRARKALVRARDVTLIDHPARGFAAACFDQVSHALTLLAPPHGDAERTLFDALRRADSIARRSGVRAWCAATPEGRAALARFAIVEAAATLAASALDVAPGPPDERGARFWLATVALEILALAEACGEQLAPRTAHHETGAPTAPTARPTTGPTPTEATMKDTTTPTTTTTVLRVLSTDATDAAWRTAGTQFVKLARDPLVAVLARHLGPDDPSLRARIAAFLETEIGSALFAAVLSAGLAAVPATAGEVPQRLARELRVRAMADAGDLVADVLMGPLREVMALYLRDVGAVTAVAAPPALEEPAARIGAPSATRERDAARLARD